MIIRKLTIPVLTVSLLGGALPPGSEGASAPTTAPATRPAVLEPEQLTVHPSAAARPWLQYKLLPDEDELSPGNAVTLYFLARRSWPDQKTTDEVLSPENGKYNYLDTPTGKFPAQYTQRLLDAYADTLNYADLGARRRDATWDTGWRERGFAGPNPFAFLNDLRHVANLLNFRGRVEVSRKNWAAAQYTMQTAFAIARHVGREPLLIHGLVEAGFAEVTLRRTVEEWVSQSDSPNLYWALTDLPHPFVDLRNVEEGDLVDFRHWKPPIAEALAGKLPADHWPELIREIVGLLRDSRPPYKRNAAELESEARRLTDATYGRGRQYLTTHGVAAEAVDGMSREQVVGTYLCREYRSAAEDLWKAFQLPYWQADEVMLRSWRALGPDQAPASENPLIQAVLVTFGDGKPEYGYPTVLNFRYQIARTDRLISIFRTIEAIRDYAAHHEGRAPGTLDQITDLPVPIDPITGKAFGYRVESQTATIDAPAPTYRGGPWSGWRYELRFVK